VTARAIVALDVPNRTAALALVDQLAPECNFYKVGSELFTSAGPGLVETLVRRGCAVFLDLKFHDIPNTVRRATRQAAALGASLVTVHAVGGPSMLASAVEGAREEGDQCGVLGVTVLTSLDAGSLAAGWGRDSVDVEQEVMRLAGDCRDAGAHGVVCSGHEARALRSQIGPSLRLLVPGIRLAGGAVGDQARVVTPADAVAAGADYLVLGRAVTGATEPLRAYQEAVRVLG